MKIYDDWLNDSFKNTNKSIKAVKEKGVEVDNTLTKTPIKGVCS